MANACTSGNQTLSEVEISETKDNDVNELPETSVMPSTFDDAASKEHDESGSTSIRAATDMPSASGDNTYCEESSDISP